mmetsp:Transcript_109401/g.315077  ORF Transcript_109401/g.315077 Transcript_109401/m.315077 type:complete len:216 (+) Transcript_109401:296-943(+)
MARRVQSFLAAFKSMASDRNVISACMLCRGIAVPMPSARTSCSRSEPHVKRGAAAGVPVSVAKSRSAAVSAGRDEKRTCHGTRATSTPTTPLTLVFRKLQNSCSTCGICAYSNRGAPITVHLRSFVAASTAASCSVWKLTLRVSLATSCWTASMSSSNPSVRSFRREHSSLTLSSSFLRRSPKCASPSSSRRSAAGDFGLGSPSPGTSAERLAPI